MNESALHHDFEPPNGGCTLGVESSLRPETRSDGVAIQVVPLLRIAARISRDAIVGELLAEAERWILAAQRVEQLGEPVAPIEAVGDELLAPAERARRIAVLAGYAVTEAECDRVAMAAYALRRQLERARSGGVGPAVEDDAAGALA